MAVRKGNWGVSYELPDSVYEELRKRAEKENTSVTTIVRRIMEKELCKKNAKKT
jgi:predicted transcriptional regulator